MQTAYTVKTLKGINVQPSVNYLSLYFSRGNYLLQTYYYVVCLTKNNLSFT